MATSQLIAAEQQLGETKPRIKGKTITRLQLHTLKYSTTTTAQRIKTFINVLLLYTARK
jgi:hypothetical protein